MDSVAVGNSDFLSGGGEIAELIRSTDWSGSPLGPPETWSQSLQTTVGLCLASPSAINIIWGPEHIQIYNQAYSSVCGGAHPAAMGEAFARTWLSAWPEFGLPFERALGGETSFFENQRMFLTRNGALEEAFFTYSFSPIRDEAGGIDGLLHPVNETTASVLAERRTRAIRDLNARLGDARTTSDVCAFAMDTLASHGPDLPFVLVYELTPESDKYRLACHVGLEAGTVAAPLTLATDASAPWPVDELVAKRGQIRLDHIAALADAVSCGPYEEPPTVAFAMPFSKPGLDRPVALMIAGVSARLPLDDAYCGYYSLLFAAVAAGLASANFYEEQRQRTEAVADFDRAKTTGFSNVIFELRARVDGAVSLARERHVAAARETELRGEIAAERGRAVLQQTEQQLAFALQAGRLGSWELDLATGSVTASDYCRTVFGLDPNEPFEHVDDIIAHVHPEDRERRQCAIDLAISTGTDLEVEYRVLRSDGQASWILKRGRAQYDAGTPTRLAGVALDITARKEAEDHLRSLLDELNHRVKNSLASVQSIAFQTRRFTHDEASFHDSFLARIAALARAHDLLSEASWEGASLEEVIRRTLEPHLVDGDGARVSFGGPGVLLGPNAAVTLHMAFHELASNAAKYGALSSADGRVDVEWRTEGGKVPTAIEIDWRESGGPPVLPSPARGFGSRMIEKGMAGELDGDALLDFAPGGLSCRIRLPLSAKLRMAA